MSQYTTGEIAKLCGVTVRTVQYYDSRGILIPTELSEGGRRLYSEDDVRKLKIICFLRELDLPINTIGELFSEPHPELIISTILNERSRGLREEIAQRQSRLAALEELNRELKRVEHFSVESIGDIAYKMAHKKKLKKLHGWMLVVGIIWEAIEVSAFMVGLLRGIWWLYWTTLAVSLPVGVLIAAVYHSKTEYICPHCHTVFKPGFWEMFFARHTPNTRKLTCTQCGVHGFCVETYAKEGN